jgi:hypothetical protein
MKYVKYIDGIEFDMSQEEIDEFIQVQNGIVDIKIFPPISPRQLRIWLIRNNINISDIDQALNSLPEGQTKEEAKIEWEYGVQFARHNPLIDSIGAIVGLTTEEIDAGFLEASLI